MFSVYLIRIFWVVTFPCCLLSSWWWLPRSLIPSSLYPLLRQLKQEGRSMMNHLFLRLNALSFLRLSQFLRFSPTAVLAASARPPTVCSVVRALRSPRLDIAFMDTVSQSWLGGSVISALWWPQLCDYGPGRGSVTPSQRHINDSLLFSRTPHSFLAKLLSRLSCYRRSVQPSWRNWHFPLLNLNRVLSNHFPNLLRSLEYCALFSSPLTAFPSLQTCWRCPGCWC